MARKVKGLYQKQSPALQKAIEAVKSNERKNFARIEATWSLKYLFVCTMLIW
jgi:hypothetical protein